MSIQGASMKNTLDQTFLPFKDLAEAVRQIRAAPDLAAERHVTGARIIDIIARKDAVERRFEGDWIKHLLRGLPAIEAVLNLEGRVLQYGPAARQASLGRLTLSLLPRATARDYRNLGMPGRRRVWFFSNGRWGWNLYLFLPFARRLVIGWNCTPRTAPASAMSAGTAETRSGSGLQPASAVPPQAADAPPPPNEHTKGDH